MLAGLYIAYVIGPDAQLQPHLAPPCPWQNAGSIYPRPGRRSDRLPRALPALVVVGAAAGNERCADPGKSSGSRHALLPALAPLLSVLPGIWRPRPKPGTTSAAWSEMGSGRPPPPVAKGADCRARAAGIAATRPRQKTMGVQEPPGSEPTDARPAPTRRPDQHRRRRQAGSPQRSPAPTWFWVLFGGGLAAPSRFLWP